MASIVQGYEYDIFISYRQKDNKYDGWVTEFVDNLKRELEATFKEEISVYFDISSYDGLLETHDVDASLKKKLKCLVCIPIISRTYCDPKSYAWEHEFKAFIKTASDDQFGLRVTLPGGNRQLRSRDDNVIKNPNQILYRDQINKVALAIRDIIESMKVTVASNPVKDKNIKINESKEKSESFPEDPVQKELSESKGKILITGNKPDGKKNIFRVILALFLFSILSIFGIIGFKTYKKNYAHNILIPEIQKMMEKNFIAPSHAFELATEAEKYIPFDSTLIRLWSTIGIVSSLKTQPEGAKVYWKDYDNPKDPWKIIGETPLRNYRIPFSYIRIKIEKA